MFRQILYTQWKSVRFGLVPLVVAAFVSPLLVVQDLGSNIEIVPGASSLALQPDIIFHTWQLWLPVFPGLALVIGVVLGLNAWNWDHRAGHVYALSLPLPRPKYVLLKMGAGLLLVLIPTAALGVGAFIAVSGLELAENLHAYPLLFTARFLMFSLLTFGVWFALASGTIRTTVIVVSVFLIALVAASPFLDSGLADWLFQTLARWPGPFEVNFGNWNLIDV